MSIFMLIFPVILMFFLMGVGIPVAVALATAGGIGLLLNVSLDSFLGVFQNTPYRSTASFLMSTLPMFILMAEFLSRAGLTRGLFDVCAILTKKIAGGLGIATVMAGAVLGALSGSSTASAATLARIAVPEMLRKGYSQEMSLGIVSVSGTLAIMIPPSLTLIIYGMMAEVSIGQLLIAGVIPGILTALLYSIVIFFWYKSSYKKKIAKEEQSVDEKISMYKSETTNLDIVENNRFREKTDETITKLLPKTLPVVLLIAIIIGGLYSGIFTATEAAAVGSFAALLIGMIFGSLDVKGIFQSLKQTAITSTMIFTIIIGATIFGYYMIFSQLSQDFVSFMTSFELSRWTILIIILIIFLVLGFFMDQLAILVLLVPLVIPLIKELDFNLIWFGILVVKTAEIGLCTPPLGLNVFVTASTTKLPIEKAFKGTSVLLIAEVMFLIILLLFPAIAIWLPNQMSS